ncbi:MAG: sodium-dependent transporter, partial [Halobacteria archaeon]
MAQWSSKLGFIFASIGAAVGLGNIWRFPVQVQQNGGGAYLIPYLLVVIFFGITLMIVEIGGGRKWGVDVVSIFEEKNNGWMGWVIVLVVTLILSYYMVIQGWIIAFVPIALTGFSVSFEALSQTYWTPVLFVISLAASGAIVMFDIEDGIERVASVLIPLVFLLILGLVVYAFSLPNYGEALNYYLRPDLSVVTDVGLWSAAFGQAFFSLALGHGILLTYGTYLGEKTNVTTTSIIITAANFLVAFFVGLVIFPFIFAANVDPANIEAG